jgi:integrative and conjugative element protein (TIGR02256 family)
MRLLITSQIVKRLHREIRRAGRQEIGGLLMGEDMGDAVFRIADISVQRSGGTHATFTRDPNKHQDQLQRFFAKNGHDYRRFNYLGEWHSHPIFEPMPSSKDLKTMQSLVEDPAVGVNFLTLLIVSPLSEGRIQMTAATFSTGAPPLPVSVAVAPEIGAYPLSVRFGWLRRIFKR